MPRQLIDEKGHIYGKLLVIEAIRRPSDRKTLWRCRYECGNEIICSGSDLRTQKRTSCGAHCNAIKNEIGHTYGYLTVLKRDDTPALEFADKSVHWICRCNLCGNIKSISEKSLRNGDTQTCGCIKSLGEQSIVKVLSKLSIPFVQEYQFADLTSPFSNLNLRFDFALFHGNKLLGLIEYQGEQHERQIAYFGNKLEKIQRCDLAKKKYCLEHDIPLLIITHIDGKIPREEDLSEQILEFIEENKNEIFT